MRVFSASLFNGVVMIDNKPVPSCPILGQGGNSEGVVVISKDELAYIPNTTTDLSDNITQVVNAFNSIVSALNAISSGVLPENGGGAITTGGFASGISEGVSGINNAISALNELKGRLK